MPSKIAFAVSAAVIGLALATPVSARTYRHHHHHRHMAFHRAREHVIPNVLVANPYGDVIIDGKTGFHRSDWGVMVPDTQPQSFVATGRASGTGLGANGLPGRNWQ